MDWLTDDFGPQAEQFAVAMRSGWVTSAIFGAITTPFIVVTWHLIVGMVHHLTLLLVGGARRDLEATLRTSMYALGVNFWSVIPVLGMLVGLWVSVCKVIGYGRVHEVPWWKGAVAVFAPFCVGCCGTALVLGAVFGFAAAAFGS